MRLFGRLARVRFGQGDRVFQVDLGRLDAGMAVLLLRAADRSREK